MERNEDIEKWASGLTEEVYEKWKEYGRPEYGFKTFVTPVKKNPTFLIIGYNPGVNKDRNSFKEDLLPEFEAGDFSPPASTEENEILSREYLLADKLCDVVFKGYEDLIEDSVKYDLYFFRSENQSTLRNQLGDDYDRMKKFCGEKTVEIIREVDPDHILIYGVTTFDKFKNIEGIEEDFEEEIELTKEDSGNRLFTKGSWKGKGVFGIIHPTGKSTYEGDLSKASEYFQSYLSLDLS